MLMTDTSNVVPFPAAPAGSLRDRAAARRAWLAARWAAELIGMDPEASRSYARELSSDFRDVTALFMRVLSDLRCAEIPVRDQALRDKIDDFQIQAEIWARCTAS